MFIRIGVEGTRRRGNARKPGQGIEESRGQVHGRLRHGERTESAAQGSHVLSFFDRGFHRIAGEDRGDERHLVGGEGGRARYTGVGHHSGGAAGAVASGDARDAHNAGAGGGRGTIGNIDGRAESGKVIEVAFQILKVECEVKDVVVGINADRGLGRGWFGGEREGGECGASAGQQGAPADNDFIEELRL